MYLKSINIENYGAIEKIKYELPFKENGDPKPLVVIGKNGTGKTLLISNIIHALIEMKRQCFDNILETEGTKYYRVGTKDYIKKGMNYSYINYKFSNDISLVDLIVNDYTQFNDKEYDDKKFPGIKINDEKLKKQGFFQETSINNNNTEIFEKNIYLYLPVDRYYSPTWLNDSNSKIKFNSIYRRYVGENKDNIIKNNLLDDIEPWLLDVIIDKLLYEERKFTNEMKSENTLIKKEMIAYLGKNSDIHNAVNEVLTNILKLSRKDCISARIGISSKRNRKISIYIKNKQGEETEYVPNFSNLSSGEIMIFCMFVSILREFDRINQVNMSKTTGIVIIDEIDAHLHLDFCRIILPKIIKMFPKIQFIITSHSPFFLLGMKEKFNDDCEFINMPDGTINNLENFEEIKSMYELVEPNYQATLNKLKEYKLQIQKMTKPIIITEGKTDWKHMKNALSELKKQNKFENMDISFLEFEDKMGDTNLENLLKQLSLFSNTNKIIGIFDNDEKVGKKYDKDSFTNLGHNVYAWCIPNSRELPYGISIEFLYDENDIKLSDKNGKRLFLSNEFKRKNLQLKTNPLITTRQRNFVETFYKENKVKIIEGDEVYDENENTVSLSKNEFANNILNKVPPFNKININNFENLFKRIEIILNDSSTDG